MLQCERKRQGEEVRKEKERIESQEKDKSVTYIDHLGNLLVFFIFGLIIT